MDPALAPSCASSIRPPSASTSLATFTLRPIRWVQVDCLILLTLGAVVRAAIYRLTCILQHWRSEPSEEIPKDPDSIGKVDMGVTVGIEQLDVTRIGEIVAAGEDS